MTSLQRACFAVAIFLAIAVPLLWFCRLNRHADQDSVLAEQDQVYEAVVRDMIMPTRGPIRVSQLVFNNVLLTESNPERPDVNSCKKQARRDLSLENGTPLYNSLADRVYRHFFPGTNNSLRADTITDFVDKFCIAGRLSQAFRTDVPREFIDPESVSFDVNSIINAKGQKSFAEWFPGAGGIISLSRVGLDPRLDEALVATSFICGGLCGSGNRYVLRKRNGSWRVVNKWRVWVS
jgi:hypothetical protein